MENANQTPIQSPISSDPSISSVPVSNHSKSKMLFIVGGFLLLLIVGGSAYYLGAQQNNPQTSNTAISPSPQKSFSKVSPNPTTIVTESKEYKSRYYNVADIFWNKEKYPVEITKISDNDLTPLYCTATYSGYDNKLSSYDEKTDKATPLTDSSLLNYIQIIKKNRGEYVSEIFSCSAENGKAVVVYSLGPCGGGCSGIAHVGVVEGSGITEVSNISKEYNEGMAYFGCRRPLQLTKQNMFYFSCGGGDGPGGSASVYKLSLNTLDLSRIQHCTAGINDTGQSFSKCE